ncbi:MAG: LacI family DNA-binding transcriptional regulator, partial [Anaerolineae bacterium]|nr:LacI family DNA-binding transcriptional regulator [Anaerolineae bacterium]
DMIEALDYRPSRVARGLTTQATFTLGVMVPDIANPFLGELISGAQVAAREQGYNVLLSNTQEDINQEIETLKLFEETRVDGVLLCSARLPDQDLFPLLARQRAVTLFNRIVPTAIASMVNVNDFFGAQQAVRHLVHTGHRCFGVLTGPPMSYSSQARASGVQQTLQEMNVPCQIQFKQDYQPNPSGGYEAAKELLSDHPEIDALICFNDQVAVGALHACHELGRRVPQDVAIVGFDNIPLASLVFPTLTTLHIDKRSTGATAIDLLISRIQGGDEPTEIVIDPELIIRESAP